MPVFTQVSGIAAPLMRDNIDTDVVIRIERLTSVPKDKLAPYAFEAIRYLPDGRDNPDFLPPQPAFLGAPILLTGNNFGCGSSRESAVWTLQSMGIQCVIAPSYGDIFFNSCFQNGVLPIVLDEARLQRLVDYALEGRRFTVDLVLAFEVDPLRRDMLLEGLDEARQEALIRAWQTDDKVRRPRVWQVAEARSLAGFEEGRAC